MKQLRRQQPKSQMRKRNKAVLVLILALLSSGMAGCSDSSKTQSGTPVGTKVKSQGTMSSPTSTAAVPTEAKVDIYVYSPKGRRDPFLPIIEKSQGKVPVGTALERFNPAEFKLSGIFWGGFGYNAMIEGPDGKGYFVKVGTILGPNRGVVKKITQNTLVIEEKYKNYAGEVSRKEIIVELRKKQEEKP